MSAENAAEVEARTEWEKKADATNVEVEVTNRGIAQKDLNHDPDHLLTQAEVDQVHQDLTEEDTKEATEETREEVQADHTVKVADQEVQVRERAIPHPKTKEEVQDHDHLQMSSPDLDPLYL